MYFVQLLEVVQRVYDKDYRVLEEIINEYKQTIDARCIVVDNDSLRYKQILRSTIHYLW